MLVIGKPFFLVKMKEIEKKAHVPHNRYDEIKRCLIERYGVPQHVFAEDVYYALPPVAVGDKKRFRIRRNYSGNPLQLQSIVANAKRKQVRSDGLEDNVENEFEIRNEADLQSFLAMMEGFGAKRWYSKQKDKWLFLCHKEVEYHLELCTLPIGGQEEHFLEIEGVYTPVGMSDCNEERLVTAINFFIGRVFKTFGIDHAVEPRAYSVLMGEKFPDF